jgi:predicted NAD/FAD-dependent oxidoreductase
LRGGTAEGERRWERFVATGLADYARKRDDPLADGHSRLSPYLHYGMVSALKLAREARAHRTDGAAKFLDELLVWRELAWSFCALEPRHATVAALPEWARATLRQHEADARVHHSAETLARAQTGDALWDAAQRGLLTRGELHNSVRMTWGKAVPGWTRDAAEALAVLVDLNHRYALDGRDPASYLGILYCLGGFDQPFNPEQPVLGKVRPRSTLEHGKRFDVAEYSRRTRRPARGQPLTVGIVGAGVAGAACARALVDAGQQATLFEQAAEGGGRCASEGDFDLGAPMFSARDRRWARWVRAWVKEGSVAAWSDAFVGTPSMGNLVKRMLHGLDVRFSTQVTSVERHGERWRLVADSGTGLGEYDAVVVATPAPRAEALLKWSAPELAALAAGATMAPQWVARLSLGEPLGLGSVVEAKVGPLVRLVCEGTKPARAPGERWSMQASTEWSLRHQAEAPEAVAAALLDAFWATTGARPQRPLLLGAHLWPQARVRTPVASPCLFDAEHRVAAAGDWCLGDGVEAAFLSGTSAAGRLNALRGDVVVEPAPAPSGAAQLRLF